MHMHWYVRSLADGDTHRGELTNIRTVCAVCGVEFIPITALRERGPKLPGYPPDPDQVCPQCRGSGSAS